MQKYTTNTICQHSVPSSTLGYGKSWICCKRQEIAEKITKNIQLLTDFNIFLQKKIINLILQEPDNFCALRTNNQGETMRKLALTDDILLKIEKPARYIGHEVNSVMKDKKAVDIRFAMCFPEVYEVGMSHLGIQILYDMFNRREDTWCERVYSPWIDLDKIMREKHIPLFTLESQDPVKEFDFLGITLQFEMCYTNVLQVLDLSGIPLHSEDRTLEDPFVIGGGPCVYNTEPLAEFFDMFYIGEGEVVYDELLEAYKKWKKAGKSRKEFLEMAADIEGIYVPSF